jgi:hypothetical protein
MSRDTILNNREANFSDRSFSIPHAEMLLRNGAQMERVLILLFVGIERGSMASFFPSEHLSNYETSWRNMQKQVSVSHFSVSPLNCVC